MKQRKVISLFVALIVAFTFTFGIESAVAAENTVTVQVPLKYGQTIGRSMLTKINDFRKGPTWYLEEDNTKVTIGKNELAPLVYDYTLEKVAMKRAAEVALRFSHTRPDNQICFSAYDEHRLTSQYAKGENIAFGQPTVNDVFEAWKEDDKDGKGQGHRRNMLSEYFTSVGIGHAVYNGYHVWVQEFSNPTRDTKSVPANNSNTNVSVTILKSNITKSSVTANKKSYAISYGSSAALPTVTTKIQTVNTPWFGPTKVGAACTWKIKDPKIASISGNKIVAHKIGKTTLTGTISLNTTKTLSIPVQVKPLTQKITAKSYNKVYGNKAFSLKATAKGRLSYKSSNTKVAKVSSKGKVTIKGTGKANITITAAAIGNYGKTTKKITVKVAPKRVSSVKAKAGKKKITVSWKKDTRATGYQIVYAQNKKFTKGKKSVTVSKYKTVKKNITKLKSKKTYYVKVRAYKKSGGTKIYGNYSTVKKVRTK